ncbi:MAG TPA: phosphoglycerate kinase [Syntrophaceae bacterium]|jgi:phosphoglycerate kinase|nr:phosphoglycerate kinase [Syntrophaceae bacterium]
MNDIRKKDVAGKNVLVRGDLNVPLSENGNMQDDFRIKQITPTLHFLLDKKAKVILCSHFTEEKISLKTVTPALRKFLNMDVIFVNDCIGYAVEQEVQKLKPGQLLLLENLRTYPGEEKNDPEFAKSLAKYADIYVNDAFGVCHRNHASVSAIVKFFLPGNVFAGNLLMEEVQTISYHLKNPKKPIVAIIGGAKIETKVKVIKKFLDMPDCDVLLGGKIAHAILRRKKEINFGAMPDQKVFPYIDEIEIHNHRIHLPTDNVVYFKKGIQEEVYDVGPETIKEFNEKIAAARTIFFNGPIGYFEDERNIGTVEILKAISRNRTAFSIVGGGETNSVIYKNNLEDKISYISTGGGAFLAFITGDRLPGLAALGYYA